MKIAKGAVIGLGVVAAIGVSVPGFAGGNKYASIEDSRECDNGVVNWVGPIKLWPPNHKFVNETVTAVADDSGETVTLTLIPTVTDATGGDGGANHDPDYTPEEPFASGTGSASVDLALRAERSGRGDGRTYTIDWVAEIGEETCASNTSTTDDRTPFVVTVPHDMRPSRR